jgi:serine/threonine-protein kinase
LLVEELVTSQEAEADGRGPWTRRRVLGAAAVSAAAPFLLLAVLHFTVGQRRPPAPVAVPLVAPEPTAVVAASASAPAAEPNVADVADAAPAPEDGVIDGLDAEEWRKLLRNTAETSEWKRGAAAILALNRLDPSLMTLPSMLDSTAKVVSQIQAQDAGLGDEVFAALSSGPHGLDVLYRLTSFRAGTKAAVKARELLKQAEVRERGSPAMRVALELREAPCSQKEALAARAAEEGDHRALVLLVPLRSAECDPYREGCCLSESAAVLAAIKAISARSKPQP